MVYLKCPLDLKIDTDLGMVLTSGVFIFLDIIGVLS